MEAVIKTSDKKIFQKIVNYLTSLGVSVYAKEETKNQRSRDINYGGLINRLTTGFNLGKFNREDAYDRH